MKWILQNIKNPLNHVEFTKFVVYFKIDNDPEIYELIADGVKANLSNFTSDEILTILVNFSHNLSTETASLFNLANSEFISRLNNNYNAGSRDLYI